MTDDKIVVVFDLANPVGTWPRKAILENGPDRVGVEPVAVEHVCLGFLVRQIARRTKLGVERDRANR